MIDERRAADTTTLRADGFSAYGMAFGLMLIR
jgi:hypothetical protein